MLRRRSLLKETKTLVKQNIRNIGLSFLCSVILLFVVGILAMSSNLLVSLSTALGAVFLLLTYGSIIGGLIFFYLLTTQYEIGLTVLSFLLNLIFWIIEQVVIEEHFHNSFLYQDENAGAVFVLLLGTFLWTVNKIALDIIFLLFRPKKQETRFEKYFRKNNSVV